MNELTETKIEMPKILSDKLLAYQSNAKPLQKYLESLSINFKKLKEPKRNVGHIRSYVNLISMQLNKIIDFIDDDANKDLYSDAISDFLRECAEPFNCLVEILEQVMVICISQLLSDEEENKEKLSTSRELLQRIQQMKSSPLKYQNPQDDQPDAANFEQAHAQPDQSPEARQWSQGEIAAFIAAICLGGGLGIEELVRHGAGEVIGESLSSLVL